MTGLATETEGGRAGRRVEFFDAFSCFVSLLTRREK